MAHPLAEEALGAAPVGGGGVAFLAADAGRVVRTGRNEAPAGLGGQGAGRGRRGGRAGLLESSWRGLHEGQPADALHTRGPLTGCECSRSCSPRRRAASRGSSWCWPRWGPGTAGCSRCSTARCGVARGRGEGRSGAGGGRGWLTVSYWVTSSMQRQTQQHRWAEGWEVVGMGCKTRGGVPRTCAPGAVVVRLAWLARLARHGQASPEHRVTRQVGAAPVAILVCKGSGKEGREGVCAEGPRGGAPVRAGQAEAAEAARPSGPQQCVPWPSAPRQGCPSVLVVG